MVFGLEYYVLMRFIPVILLLIAHLGGWSQYDSDSATVIAFQLPVVQEDLSFVELDSLVDPLGAEESDLFVYQVSIFLPDTLSLLTVDVELREDDQIFDAVSFGFDQSAPGACEYYREGQSLLLTMNEHLYRDTFLCEVVFNDQSGIPSAPVLYVVEPILFEDE